MMPLKVRRSAGTRPNERSGRSARSVRSAVALPVFGT
jgi:hypothetical protein